MAQPTSDRIEALRAAHQGPVLVPGDEGYDEARRVWNADVDRRPAVITRCTTTGDVSEAVRYAVAEGLEVAVRGGAHAPSGHAVVDEGLMVDLSLLNGVTVDPETRRAVVGGGALLGDVIAAAQEHGLATPVGAVSHTGVGGLTLGGGMGWLSRKHGLTIDNLVRCEVVTADGQVRHASAEENPELFWALRGGGGNFGVVTTFELALHPVGPMIRFAMLFWSVDVAATALRGIRDVVDDLPPEANVVVVGFDAPAAPFVPAQHHGVTGFAAVVAGFGTQEEHDAVVARLRAAAPPLFSFETPMPYLDLQRMLDEANAWGQYAYDKGAFLEHLTDPAIDTLVEHLPRRAAHGTMCLLYRLDRAFADVDEDATAFSGSRLPCYQAFFVAVCPDRETLAKDREWVRGLHAAMQQHATETGTYVNAMTGDSGEDRVRQAYGKVKYDRLAEIKQRYDPANVFHRNANIRPAVAT